MRIAPLGRSLAVNGAVAGAYVLCVVPFLGRYGWDRDELYFVSASKRPTFGYVDFPPLVAWLGWAVREIFGTSLVALRLTTLLLMALTVLLVGLMARELGAGLGTQATAAAAWAFTPYALGAGSIFHPTWLDIVCWVALLATLLVAFARERPRLWLVAGVIGGVGLEAKYTIAVLLAAVLVSLSLTNRRVLATRWPWLGLGIAVALTLPNLAWQAAHGWPSVAFAPSQNAKTAEDTPPLTYIAQQLFLGAGILVVAVGVVVLWRRHATRPLALLPPIITLFFFLTRGRAYYPLPADSIAIAAGVTGIVAWLRRGHRWRRAAVLAPLVALHVALVALALPIVVPVRSTASMVSSGVWKDSFYKDEIGWPELTEQTAAAWRSLPASLRARTAIVAGNYGEASALEHYGPRRGLPQPLSGHLSWQYWRPRSLPQRSVLFVGYGDRELTRLCTSWRTLAVIDNRWRLDNEERGRTISHCTLRMPLGAIWDQEIATDDL